MVILMLTPPVLSPGFTHDASDYQISTDPLFSSNSIVKEVLGDTTNKLIKTFDLDLDPEVQYYARARYVLNRFIAEWSNIDIIIPKDVSDLNIHMDIPSVVSIPQISLDFNTNNMPTTFFTITTNNIATTSNAQHLFTSYIITDTDGNVHLSNIEDTKHLNSFKVIKDKLPENKTYILHVQHGSTSGDVSDFGKVVFKTTTIGGIDLLSNSDMVKGTDLLVKLAPVSNVSIIYTSLYAVGATDNKLLREQSGSAFVYNISNTYFLDNTDDYMLSIKFKYNNNTYSPIRYIPIKAY